MLVQYKQRGFLPHTPILINYKNSSSLNNIREALIKDGITYFQVSSEELPNLSHPRDLTDEFGDFINNVKQKLWEVTKEIMGNGLIPQQNTRAGKASENGGLVLSATGDSVQNNHTRKSPQFTHGALAMHSDGLADSESLKDENGVYNNRVKLLGLHCYIPADKGGANRIVSAEAAYNWLKKGLISEELELLQIAQDSKMSAYRGNTEYPFIPIVLNKNGEIDTFNWTHLVSPSTGANPLFRKVNRLINNCPETFEIAMSAGQGLLLSQKGKAHLHARRSFPFNQVRLHEKIWGSKVPQ